jgi:hypothetical protein
MIQRQEKIREIEQKERERERERGNQETEKVEERGLYTTFIKVNSRFCILAKCLRKIITLTRKSITELASWPNLSSKSSRATELL